MERTLRYTITTEEAGQSVHSFLRRHGYSRHILSSMKPHPDAVRLNGAAVYMSQILQPGDVLSIRLRDEESSENVVPAPVPFRIVYEDEDILVIDKPAGVAIHPAPGHPAETLANGVAYYFQQKGIPYVFRCINRLDRDTTGLLILANHALSASVLEQDLLSRRIHRTYLAIAEGILPEAGTIDLPISRKKGSLIKRCIDPENGDRAVTHFRTLQTLCLPLPDPAGPVCPGFPTCMPASAAGYEPLHDNGSAVSCSPADCSLVELHLDTGRTHQIRVHLTAKGHPLLGDTLYNPRYQALYPFDPLQSGSKPSDAFLRLYPCCLPRQALHSWKLEFRHPVTGEALQFTSPLPEDFQRCIDAAFR